MLDRSVLEQVRKARLTYLGQEKLSSLYDCVEEVGNAEIPGDLAEFGVALGGSGICLARTLKEHQRYLGFDVYDMIPPPTEADGEDVSRRYETIAAGKSKGINGDTYYGYVENLYDAVKENFAKWGKPVDDESILLVKGLFSDSLPKHPDLKLSLAHIDCDWYEPVLYCLEYVWPRLSPGGFIVLDDYNDWAGCKKAATEFLAANKEAEVLRFKPHAVLRKPGPVTAAS